MTLIRPAAIAELPLLSELCMRSKAYWGYDEAFIEACRDELTLAPRHTETTSIAVAEDEGKIVGLAQTEISGSDCNLLKLFVEPEHIGRGYGRRLFTWAVSEGRRRGATRMTIESDPDAEEFYRRMGAWPVGKVPSRSIPGRELPLLRLSL